MKNKNAKTMVIVGLCCLVVFMSLGFSLLSQTLNINGTATATNTWAVLIESITPIKNNTGANSTLSEVLADKVSASFKVEFQKPGDYMEYEIVVANRGSIDAVLKSVESSIEPFADKELYTFDCTEAPKDQTLKAGETTTFKINVTYNLNANRIPTVDAGFGLKLNYEQVSKSSDVVTPDADSSFDVSQGGELIAYNSFDGGTVVVPATVNGTPVRKITEQSFVKKNVAFYIDNSTGLVNGVIYEEDLADFESVKEKGILIFAAQQCGGGDACVNQIRNMVNFVKPGELTFPADAAIQTVYINPDANLTWDQSVGNTEKIAVINLDLSNAVYLEEIGDYAFQNSAKGTDKLEEVIFPEDGVLKTIGASAFKENNLQAVIIPDSVETIGMNAFLHDSDTNSTKLIGTLVLGEGIKHIGDRAFYNNELSTVEIPASIESIGNDAFNAQRATLTDIIINRTQEDFLANVSVGTDWYDDTLNPTISYK